MMSLIFNNSNKVVWRTKDGRQILLRDLGDQHLQNIIKKIYRMNMAIPPQLKEECRRRGLPISLQELDTNTIGERLSILEKKLNEQQKRLDDLAIQVLL